MTNIASAQGTSVFTTGLNAPAKTTVAGSSSLLVSESGTMANNSGRISLVNRTTGARRTLIDGLPSGITRSGGAPEASGHTNYTLGSANGQIFAQFWDGTANALTVEHTTDDQ